MTNLGRYVDPDRERMSRNNGGGRSFVVDDWTVLDRILTLGTDGGTYYVSERELSESAIATVGRLLKEDGVRVVQRTVEISEAGRAPKNDYAIFVIAYASVHGDDATRKEASEALPRVCRTGTHLFFWMHLIRNVFGKGLSKYRKDAVRSWYSNRNARGMAYQAMKYRQRAFDGDSWTHKDVLCLAGAKFDSKDHNDVAYWIQKGWDGVGSSPHPDEHLRQIWAFEKLKRAESISEVTSLIRDHNLPREAVPTEWFSSDAKRRAMWEALLPSMPYTAMMRNLGNMSACGFLEPGTPEARLIAKRLQEQTRITKARVHPMNILAAYMTYKAGRGVRGSKTWNPVVVVNNALDEAFYKAFGNVEDCGKDILIGLDVSGSMTCSALMNIPGLDCRLASAAMALIYLRTQKSCRIMGFSHTFQNINIQDGHRLSDVINIVSRMPFGATNCALPMTWASANKNRFQFDAFMIFTDNETNHGRIHPHKALQNYRRETGRNSSLVVNAMAGTRFSIADPKDPLSLDVSGFDSGVPSLITQMLKQG